MACTTEIARGTISRREMLAHFRIEESQDAGGAPRLTVLGELDLTVAPTLDARLAVLREGGAPVRLDLSRLEFINPNGIRVVTPVAQEARRGGWEFELDRELSPSGRRPLELLGVDAALWPEKA